jgi:hypothetical protein
MKATETENKISQDTLKNILIIFFGCLSVASFVFSTSTTKTEPKVYFEYRPIVVTNTTKALNTAYTPSTSRSVLVTYSSQITSTLSLSGGQSGSVTLQISDNTGANYVTVATTTNNNTGSLTLGLNTAQVQAGPLVGVVPPGCSYKLVSSGGSSFSALTGQEISL